MKFNTYPSVGDAISSIRCAEINGQLTIKGLQESLEAETNGSNRTSIIKLLESKIRKMEKGIRNYRYPKKETMSKPVITITVTPDFENETITSDINVKGDLTLTLVLESILPLIERLAEIHEQHPNLTMGDYDKEVSNG